MENPPKYVLIAGHGRSGTNWLLDLLDLSPRTHCRSEANALEGSALAKVPRGWVSGVDIAGTWDEAVLATSRSFGARDRLPATRKDHLRGFAQQLGPVRVMQSARSRRALAPLFPRLRGQEWLIPGWIAPESSMSRALPVLKINQMPGWMAWVLAHRPEARVLHIVRHPGGFINSHLTRYVAKGDGEAIARENRKRLAMIAAKSPTWAGRFGDIEALSLIESELWFWRYSSEVTHEAGLGNPNYQRVIYEDLTQDPVGVAKSVFEGCGLPWDDEIERRVRQSSAESRSIATNWRTRSTAEQVEAIDSVLDGSFLREWWPTEAE